MRRARYHQHGSVYIMVLSSALLVTIIGLAAILAARVQQRSVQLVNDSAEVRICAQSALELGCLYVLQDTNWRTTRSNGTWVANQALGQGTYSLIGIDPVDSDLTDNPYEPLQLTGIGSKGQCVHKTQVLLVADIRALDVLACCMHASGELKINNGKQIVSVGAPLSTNDTLNNDGTIDGDAEAVGVVSSGTITGNLTTPIDPKPMPDAQVIADYIARATTVPFPGTIDKQVLSPEYNPWGPVNTDGVYYIHTGGNDMTIKNSRIHGTLIVDTAGKTLKLDEFVFIHPYRLNYPVLLVIGQLEIIHDSADGPLDEDSKDTNFNPAGAPYLGTSDTDETDQYPNEIQGLIHVKGYLKFMDTACVRGAIICDGLIECDGTNTLIYDTRLYANPPEGYTYIGGMKVSPHSYQQVVDE